MEIIRHPDTEHVQQLHAWLEEEEAETGEGFLCNWNIIASTYEEDRLYVAVQNGEAVALLSWWQYSAAAGIDILTVKPSQRRFGIGKLLVDAFISDMIEQQISIVKIQAAPVASQ